MKPFFLLLFCLAATYPVFAQAANNRSYTTLQDLFTQWRAFEHPPLRNGTPDYTTATFTKRQQQFNQLQQQLQRMDTTGWTVAQQCDWMLVYAEMNGYDFNQRILRPWQRDPAFYKTIFTERSDVPAHEGPTHHAVIELWQYRFPLSPAERVQLLQQLRVIAPLQEQARANLTGNARDLWIAGIRDISTEATDLAGIKLLPGVAADEALVRLIDTAIASTNGFVAWLQQQSAYKNGPSGIGKDNYTWYQNKVHLVPFTWEEEVALLKRELSRAWAALQLEEHRNRLLPPLPEAGNSEAYAALADKAATSLMDFLRTEDIVTVKPYYEAALRAHLGSFVPKEQRHFFWITAHYDPRPLYSHFYHWFELARMDQEPHPNPIRRGALLYNIFDNRNEGLATAVEEWFMHEGLYDSTPRSREIVYIMIAQRAARGLGSLYAHANMMNMETAGGLHSEYTPRGWMKTEKELQFFEQQLYLRQPGYGTSYITGKILLESAMAEYARQQFNAGKPFVMKTFMDFIDNTGCIPVQLVAWELTGIRDVWKTE